MLRQKANHFFLVLFIVFSCFMLSTKPVKAASITETIGSWFATVFSNDSTTKNVQAGASGTVSQETSIQSSTANLFSTLNLHMTGMASLKQSALNESERKALEKQIGYGVLGDINNGIVALYTPPASAQTYVADVMKSARIIPEAQAQGLGFSALDPILDTWKSFRNLAYLFFVVIFLVIGFMIMFRAKVGQAAITAQQAIPSVIVAMLAVTFSYAIAGFLIDLMYVVMYMLAGYFSEGSEIVTKNIFGLVGLMFGGGTLGSTQNAIEQFMEDALNIGLVGEALSYMSSLLGTVIVGVAILFATFRVFFELVKTYVAVIIQIIFSPIILMMGAIPGKNVFGGWIKNVVGNLILWPVVLICILVQRMLTAPIRSLGNEDLVNSSFGGGFMPPFLVGQGQGAIIPVILGVGILLVIPEIMQQVKKAMGVDEGVFGQLVQAMGKSIQGGAPIGSKAGLGGAGAVAGGIFGVGKGLFDTAGTGMSFKDRLATVAQTTGHYAGQGGTVGAKVGGKFSDSIGGKTPAIGAPIEKALDLGLNYFGEEETLKRIAEGENFVERRQGKSYETRLQDARNQRNRKAYERKRMKEGLYGQEVTINKD